MKNIFLFFVVLITGGSLSAQKKELPKNIRDLERSVVEEGIKLYQLEMATSQGLAIFKDQLTDFYSTTAGYFSYKDNQFYKCVFFNNKYDPQIIATVTFDSLFKKKKLIDTTVRTMTNTERELNAIRQRAIDDMKVDTFFFKMFTNTTTCILPMISGNTKKVYVLTRSLDSAAIIFGNDYVYDFDSKNYLSSKKSLHSEMAVLDCPDKNAPQDESPEKITHLHKAETDDYITATDVCILMLNQKVTKWKHHIVKSKDFVSIWYADSNEVQTVTRKKWGKYNNDEEAEPQESVAMKSSK